MNLGPRLLVLVAALSAVSGCAWVSKSKFDAAQSQNRILSEQNKAQLAEIENIKIHARKVEDQLIKAEEQLAQLDERYGRDRQKLANLKSERDRVREEMAGLSGGAAGIPLGLSDQLADLAQRYPSLQFDPHTGISKLDTDVLFDSGDSQLKPAADRMLGEFAEILTSAEGQDMKIMVVGHTDTQGIKGREVRQKFRDNWQLSTGRALAVAERLKRAGVPEDRMGVAGFGAHQPVSPNDTAEARRKNRRVEIFVVGPNTPVVGWTETLGTLYR